jgi:hypothetical protein
MGRDINAFVPVKYGTADDQEKSPALNLMIGASFAMLMVLIYRSMHGKGGNNAGGKKGTSDKGSSGSGGGFGGGGGLNDLMGMSKSGA